MARRREAPPCLVGFALRAKPDAGGLRAEPKQDQKAERRPIYLIWLVS